MSRLFSSGGQSIGALASVLSKSIQLISFKIDWFDLLAFQGTLKSPDSHNRPRTPLPTEVYFWALSE